MLTKETCQPQLAMPYTMRPMTALTSSEPMVPMSMALRPPTLSVSGPVTRKERPYTQAPTAKMVPNWALVIKASPNALLATVRL